MKSILYFIFTFAVFSITAMASPTDEKTCAYNLPLPEDLSLKLSTFSGMEAVDILAELESMPVSSVRLLVNKMDRKLVRTLWDIKTQIAYESRAVEIEADPIKKAAFDEALAIAKALREPHDIESMAERIDNNRNALIDAFGEEFTRNTFYSIGVEEPVKNYSNKIESQAQNLYCNCSGTFDCSFGPEPPAPVICYNSGCITTYGCGFYWDGPCRGQCTIF